MTKQIISAAMCLTLCISLSGCAAVGKEDRFIKKDDSFSAFKWPWQDKEEEPYPSPVKMAVTWTPDILVQPGRTPTRGFGGRVYFYNEKSQAVPVEGDLMVHGFDETAMAEGNQDRTKRYRFTADQFKTKFSKTDLGASYSIWIPWDASGGHESQLSLVPSFKTSEGKVIQGEAARLLLPGKKRENIARAKRASAIRQVGHYVGDMAQHDGLSGSMGLQTTTIPLPASFQQRLSHMREQPRITNANRIAMPVIQRPPAQTQVLPTPTAAAE